VHIDPGLGPAEREELIDDPPSPTMKRSRFAWGLAIVDIVAVVVARLADPAGDVSSAALYGLGISSFALVGALLSTRVPRNPIGAMLLAAGTILIAAVTLGAYADIGVQHDPPWLGSGAAGTIGRAMLIYPIVIGLIGIPLHFPDGRLASPRFRWAVWVTVGFGVVWALEVIFPLLLASSVASAIPGLATMAAILDALQVFVFFATIVSFGSAMVAIWLRFRRGDPVQRQQVKWLVAVVSLGATDIPVTFIVLNSDRRELADLLNTVGLLALIALPIAIGIAVLRYRLYEIDRIVSRTIAYGVLTLILVAAYSVVILVLQGPLGAVTGGDIIPVALSTLLVAALFQPVRRRVQALVDRRFDRARFETEQTTAAFGNRLREDLDIESVTNDLRATVEGALRPSRQGLWLREAVKWPSTSDARNDDSSSRRRSL
jgi:hypothetical protein